MIQVAADIATKVRLQGVWNIQLFDNNGDIKLVEINPRFAGSFPLIEKAGLNLTGLTLDLWTGKPIYYEKLLWNEGVGMSRHLEEIFYDGTDI